MTGFWLTVRVFKSFHARASQRLTKAFFDPAGGFRTLPDGAALTTVYRFEAVARRPNLGRGAGEVCKCRADWSIAQEEQISHLAARKVQASSRLRTGRSMTCSGSGTVEESATLVGQMHSLSEDVPAS